MVLSGSKGRYAQKFPRTYSAGNFAGIATADVVCQPTQWNKVGTLTVPAQQAVAWGNTDIINGGATGGIVYIRFDNSSGTQLTGTVRLCVANATETDVKVVSEQRTERLSASATGDRSINVLLPEDFRYAEQDSKLIVQFYPDSATAVTIDYDGTNTKMILPVTILQ